MNFYRRNGLPALPLGLGAARGSIGSSTGAGGGTGNGHGCHASGHRASVRHPGGDAFYGEGRWGDYTGTAVDNTLANSPSVWFSGMYAESDRDWGTWIGANQPAVP